MVLDYHSTKYYLSALAAFGFGGVKGLDGYGLSSS